MPCILRWHKGQADLVLYDNGDTKSAVTGGWEASLDGCGYSDSDINTNFTFGDRHVIRIRTHALRQADGGYDTGAVLARTKNKINVSKYNTLRVILRSNGNTGTHFRAYRGLFSSANPGIRNGGSGNGITKQATLASSDYGKFVEKTLDISSLTGSYYIGVYQRTNVNEQINAYVYKVWLTR